jgi:hypothetical protein
MLLGGKLGGNLPPVTHDVPGLVRFAIRTGLISEDP